jgi:hypothetical protein
MSLTLILPPIVTKLPTFKYSHWLKKFDKNPIETEGDLIAEIPV